MKKLYTLLSLILLVQKISIAQQNTFPATGNTGIGTTTPTEKLHVIGNVKFSGMVKYGETDSRTEFRNNAGLRGDAGAQSGFFQSAIPVNYPKNATNWWHLLDVRHDNPGNNYAMQLSGSFFDQRLYFRKTNNSPTQPWSEIITIDSTGRIKLDNDFSAGKKSILIGGYVNGGAIRFGASTNDKANRNLEFGRVESNGIFTPAMTLLSDDGNVGIGTGAPLAKLDIAPAGFGKQSISISSSLNNAIFNTYDSDATTSFAIGGTTNSKTRLFAIHSSGKDQGAAFQGSIFEVYGHNGNYNIPALSAKNNGNVGIGTITPSGLLQVGESISDAGSQTVRIVTPKLGDNQVAIVGQSVQTALHLDGGNEGNYNRGLAIELGLKSGRFGSYTSRIIHYGNGANTQASKLQLQTMSAGGSVWNTGLLIDHTGKVGVGTISPSEALEVNGNIRSLGAVKITDSKPVSSGEGSLHIQSKSSINKRLYFGFDDALNAGYIVSVDFGNKYLNTIINPFDGGVGIGISTLPLGYKLAVGGDVIAERIVVKLKNDWPDYVFKNDYQLRTLQEVEQIVKTQNHLPDVPSEKEIQEKGIDVGQMNSILLKKVEELTLYMIQMQKNADAQSKEIEELRALIKKDK